MSWTPYLKPGGKSEEPENDIVMAARWEEPEDDMVMAPEDDMVMAPEEEIVSPGMREQHSNKLRILIIPAWKLSCVLPGNYRVITGILPNYLQSGPAYGNVH